LGQFNWNYASIVHSNSEYGETGYEAIKRAVANESKLCLTEPHVIHNQVTFYDQTGHLFQAQILI